MVFYIIKIDNTIYKIIMRASFASPLPRRDTAFDEDIRELTE